MPVSEVFNEDNMIGMARYPDKFFDLAVIDPEYGLNIASQGKIGNCSPFGGKKNFGIKNTKRKIIPSKDYGKENWDLKSSSKSYFDELFRVSKNQIIFGANHFISKIPYDSPCWIVWDKLNSGNYADCELAWTSFKSVVKKVDFRWNGMLQGNMKEKEERIHPTQKPIPLYRWILNNYAQPGDKVIDTHMGSGSSRIAAHQLGFDFYGWELNERYFKNHLKRFELITSQQQLF